MSNKLPDLSHLRGMSDPFFFAFNILDERADGRMIGHAVIFTSFELDKNANIKLCAPEDDPRMQHFIHYTIENYGKKAKSALAEEIKRSADNVNELQKKILSLRRQLHDAENNHGK